MWATFGIQFKYLPHSGYHKPPGDFRRDVFRLSPALWRFSPKWLFSPKSPVSKGPGRFSIIASPLAIFPKMAIFAQIASLKGAGTFFVINASPLAIFAKIANFAKMASL